MERHDVLRAGCNSPPAVMAHRAEPASDPNRGDSRFGCDPRADGIVRMKENGFEPLRVRASFFQERPAGRDPVTLRKPGYERIDMSQLSSTTRNGVLIGPVLM